MPNSYKNAKVDLTSTNATVLYTAPGATTTLVKSILVSEDTGNADTITVTIDKDWSQDTNGVQMESDFVFTFTTP